jgi:hypothetical protein
MSPPTQDLKNEIVGRDLLRNIILEVDLPRSLKAWEISYQMVVIRKILAEKEKRGACIQHSCCGPVMKILEPLLTIFFPSRENVS